MQPGGANAQHLLISTALVPDDCKHAVLQADMPRLMSTAMHTVTPQGLRASRAFRMGPQPQARTVPLRSRQALMLHHRIMAQTSSGHGSPLSTPPLLGPQPMRDLSSRRG